MAENYHPTDIAELEAAGLTTSQANDFMDQYGHQEGDYWSIDNFTHAGDPRLTSFLTGTAQEEGDARLNELMGMSFEQGIATIREQEAAANRMIEANIERFPEVSEVSQDVITSAIGNLNEFTRLQFEKALDDLYPEWREDIVGAGAQAQKDSVDLTDAFRKNILPEMIKRTDEMSFQAMQNVSSMLAGEVPADVEAQLRRTSAELAQQIGVRGQAAQYLTARDLGLTSLQMMEAGLNQAPAALGLGAQGYGTAIQALQAPIATGTGLTNLLSAYRAPQGDAFSMYQNSLGMLFGQGAVSPNVAYQSSGQVIGQTAQLVTNTALTQAQMSSQNYWNQVERQDMLNAVSMQNKQRTGAMIGTMAGAAIGFAIPGGGAMGAMIGGQLGGQLGGGLS